MKLINFLLAVLLSCTALASNAIVVFGDLQSGRSSSTASDVGGAITAAGFSNAATYYQYNSGNNSWTLIDTNGQINGQMADGTLWGVVSNGYFYVSQTNGTTLMYTNGVLVGKGSGLTSIPYGAITNPPTPVSTNGYLQTNGVGSGLTGITAGQVGADTNGAAVAQSAAALNNPVATNLTVWGDSNRTNLLTFSNQGLQSSNAAGQMKYQGGTVTVSGSINVTNATVTNVLAGYTQGNGGGLTNLNAANLTGTLPSNAIPVLSNLVIDAAAATSSNLMVIRTNGVSVMAVNSNGVATFAKTIVGSINGNAATVTSANWCSDTIFGIGNRVSLSTPGSGQLALYDNNATYFSWIRFGPNINWPTLYTATNSDGTPWGNLRTGGSLTVTNGYVFPSKATAPTLGAVGATNQYFEWVSNSTPPTKIGSYYDGASNLVSKAIVNFP